MPDEEDFAPIRDAIMDEFYRYMYPYRGSLFNKSMAIFFADRGVKGVCLWCGKPVSDYKSRPFCKRGSEHSARFHNRYSWMSIRYNMLKEHPVCQICGKEKATEIHHIVPLIDGGSFYRLDNLIALCHSCHVEAHRELNQIKAAERRREGWEEFYKHQQTLPGLEPTIPDEGVKQE